MNENAAYIGILNKDGSVDSVWCKWDGQPFALGPKLRSFYNTAKRVRQLVSLGNLVSVGEMANLPAGCTCFKDADPCLSITYAFYRDCGPKYDLEIRHDDNVDSYRKMKNDNHSFAYLYKSGKWYVVDCRDNTIRDDDWNRIRNDKRLLNLLTDDYIEHYGNRDVDGMDA